MLKAQNLPGVLPRELTRLPYLEEMDLTRNYLISTIPVEWAALPLVNISLLGNCFSGPIPMQIGNIAFLKTLVLEYIQFCGVLPQQLGGPGRHGGNWSMADHGSTFHAYNLISSNNFTRELPASLANLTNLQDFWISDNHFTGKIPDFIQNWIHLGKLAIQSSGLEGPIPLSILASPLSSLTDMVLRNCNISGEIPPYVRK